MKIKTVAASTVNIISVLGVAAIIGGLLGYSTKFLGDGHKICTDEVVVKLVKNEYRTLTVETNKGSLVQLYTPTIQPGDHVKACK